MPTGVALSTRPAECDPSKPLVTDVTGEDCTDDDDDEDELTDVNPVTSSSAAVVVDVTPTSTSTTPAATPTKAVESSGGEVHKGGFATVSLH